MMTFEYPVKVGSNTKRIDILIQRDGVPFIVVECKRRTSTGKGASNYGKRKSMGQAVSYADAQMIKAEYAVFTDGDAWEVQRKVGPDWLPVVDIPEIRSIGAQRNMHLFFDDIHRLEVLLHKLNKPLKEVEAQIYFLTMQEFFHGYNNFTHHGNADLGVSIDHLLRCIVHFRKNDGYLRDKFFASYRILQAIGKQLNSNWADYPPNNDEHPFRYTGSYQYDITTFLSTNRATLGGIAYELDLLASLLGYCQLLAREEIKQLPLIPPTIFNSLRELLNFYCRMEFDRALPSPNDEFSMFDLRSSCASSWENQKKEHRSWVKGVNK